MNSERIKLLADKMATEYSQISIPTGELYKSIAQSNYWKAKGELHGAIDELEARVREAFFDGYNAKRYYYEDEVTDSFEEWKKYNNES